MKEVQEEMKPWEDPENVDWMEKQLQEGKELFGEDFGEDLDVDFEGQ